jgi:hypothetical protein
MEVREPSEIAGEREHRPLSLQHDLDLALDNWTRWSAISEQIVALGAELRTLRLTRVGAHFSVRCRLTGLSEDGGRDLLRRVLDGGLAIKASIEHLVLSDASAGPAP